MQSSGPRSTRHYGAALSVLTFLFALRVFAQAIQRWAPQPFLPAFDAFQGSNLPYGLLLSAQVVILGAMVRTAWRAHFGEMSPSPRIGRVLNGLGILYMAVSLGRIVIGLAVPNAPAWFSTWIPATFHVVLAAFVLVAAQYHRKNSAIPLR
jgi:hypothetical protein